MLTLAFILLTVNICNANQDYYWRDYTGKIPSDAFVAGQDVNQEKVYIGLVYLKSAGIVPTTILQGQKVTDILSVGNLNIPEKTQNYVQILCTDTPQMLEWITANKTHFHFLTMNKHVVRGGVQTDHWLSIGRVYYQNEIIIGKILSGRATINDAFMQYVHSNDITTAYSYEVLVNKESDRDSENELIEIA
ncbi:uncharacterized protein LOC126742966 [Anthonomus grandis grandis]|uniref:uncharacterized protein LOC126742966 n=1 Tax=Anthonomus grandis grandis TaxID=2921223 RepID=UPI002165FE0F|nr:uncharacterized protein LOC126742966 [Anthonomus grandis grandis]